ETLEQNSRIEKLSGIANHAVTDGARVRFDLVDDRPERLEAPTFRHKHPRLVRPLYVQDSEILEIISGVEFVDVEVPIRRGSGNQERIAIVREAEKISCAEQHGSARFIEHIDGNAKLLAERRCKAARHGVEATASIGGHDDGDRLIGP